MSKSSLSFPSKDGVVVIAGSRCEQEMGDFAWVQAQQHGNLAVKFMAYGLRKIFRSSLAELTVDIDSFKHAIESAPRDVPRVLIPIHRSYFDFLAAGYLLYARPDLDIPLPHIAAAEEFGQMPFIGKLLGWCGAFYIRRGQGKEDVSLTEQIEGLVKNRETFEFFIEGTRSRSRQFLAPKRGLLRCLQSTGEQFALFPIAISYDRVPDENSYIEELSGGEKPKMTLSKLLNWYRRMRRGEIQLGRMHIACAPPLVLDKHSDVYQLANNVVAELQAHTYASTFHLDHFLRQHPSVNRDALLSAIDARGGCIIASPLDASKRSVPPLIQHTFRYQWLHLFVDDALDMQPNNAALKHFSNCIRYQSASNNGGDSVDSSGLLDALFAPVCDNYVLLIRQVAAMAENEALPPLILVQRCLAANRQADVPVLQNAIDFLLQGSALVRLQDKSLRRGQDSQGLLALADSCIWRLA